MVKKQQTGDKHGPTIPLTFGCTLLMPRMLEGVCPGWLEMMVAGLLAPGCDVTSFTIVAPCGKPDFVCTDSTIINTEISVHSEFTKQL